jgi:hypothetical protein
MNSGWLGLTLLFALLAAGCSSHKVQAVGGLGGPPVVKPCAVSSPSSRIKATVAPRRIEAAAGGVATGLLTVSTQGPAATYQGTAYTPAFLASLPDRRQVPNLNRPGPSSTHSKARTLTLTAQHPLRLTLVSYVATTVPAGVYQLLPEVGVLQIGHRWCTIPLPRITATIQQGPSTTSATDAP